MFWKKKTQAPEPDHRPWCIVCMQKTDEPCLSRGYHTIGEFKAAFRICKPCGSAVVEAVKHYVENPPELAPEDKQSEDAQDEKLPYAKPGQVEWVCTWCSKSKDKVSKLFNVRMIYDVDGQNGRETVFCGLTDGTISVYCSGKNPELKAAVFVCDECGKKASELQVTTEVR